MNPQGVNQLNLQVFANITAAAEAAPDAATLQALVNTAYGSLGALRTAMFDQQVALQPIVALLTPPAANSAAIVAWITAFIAAFLTPITKPATFFTTQIGVLDAQVAAMNSAIAASAAQRFPGATITFPTLPGGRDVGIDPVHPGDPGTT